MTEPKALSQEARAELVRLAQEATHGVWHVWSSRYEGMKAAIVVVTPDDKSNTLFEARNYPDAVFVAAANPSAILFYEATVQALEQEMRDVAAEANRYREALKMIAIRAPAQKPEVHEDLDNRGDIADQATALEAWECSQIALAALQAPPQGGSERD